MQIRPAKVEDLPVLLQFEQGIIATERPFDPTLADDPINYYDLRGMMDATDVCLLVADTGEEVIASGYARIEAAKPYLRHSRYAYLGFMYVVPEHRGKGINRQIIDALQEWTRSKNIREIRLEVYCENAQAIKAYDKIGFRKLLIEMRREI